MNHETLKATAKQFLLASGDSCRAWIATDAIVTYWTRCIDGMVGDADETTFSEYRQEQLARWREERSAARLVRDYTQTVKIRRKVAA